MTTDEMRELDAWIAEHVMRRKCNSCVDGLYKKLGDAQYAEMREWFISQGSKKIQWPKREPDIKCDHAKRYSTDPAAAMEVLEKCTDRLDCEDIKIGFCTGIWRLQSVYRENPGANGRIIVRAETLPLAICLFAKELFK